MKENPIEPKDTFQPSIGNGITIRQYIAAQILAGLSANPHELVSNVGGERRVKWAVSEADALIAELNKPVQP